MVSQKDFRMSEEELGAYAQDGFLIRHGVFSPSEIETMAAECESLVDRLVRDRVGRRVKAGSYVFDADLQRFVMIKWEGDTDVVHGIEPFAHLSPPIHDWAHDPRLLDPMVDVLDTPEPALFTEKLNLKRPHHGGPNPLHQDYPYWVDVADDPGQVATTIIYLDDSNQENGCTWVVPGSHRQGVWKKREDSDAFGNNEVDTAAYPDAEPIPVEVPAGTTVSFSSYLVHQSTPNTSDKGRRALLFSYQPAGHITMLERMRADEEKRQRRKGKRL